MTPRLFLVAALGCWLVACAAKNPIPAPVPDIKHNNLPNAVMGQPYQAQLIGGKLMNGKLPSGMTLSASGELSGTPLAVGTYTFTVSQ